VKPTYHVIENHRLLNIYYLGTSKYIENSKLKSNKDPVSQQFIKNSLDQSRTNNQNLNEFSQDICTNGGK